MLRYSTFACSISVVVAVQGKTRFVVESLCLLKACLFFSAILFDPVWSDTSPLALPTKFALNLFQNISNVPLSQVFACVNVPTDSYTQLLLQFC